MLRQFAILFASSVLAACADPSDDYSGSYVGGDQTTLLQLNMVEADGGQISGNFAVSQLDYSAGKVNLTTRPISGMRNDSQISIVAKGDGWNHTDAPLTLQASGNTLMLFIPGSGQSIEMQPMKQEAYREKLAEFAQALNANDVGLTSTD